MNIGERFICSKCMMELPDEGICQHCGYDPRQPIAKGILEEGTVLHDGRYQLGAAIGTGGFGITYAAWDLILDQPVAIKEYFPLQLCERAVDSDNVVSFPDHGQAFTIGMLRFIREARILCTLQDIKNVVPVYEWFESNNTAYIVMKYIRGVTLETFVRNNSIDAQTLIAHMKELIESLMLVHNQGIWSGIINVQSRNSPRSDRIRITGR